MTYRPLNIVMVRKSPPSTSFAVIGCQVVDGAVTGRERAMGQDVRGWVKELLRWVLSATRLSFTFTSEGSPIVSVALAGN
jgi:hypothetical protein